MKSKPNARILYVCPECHIVSRRPMQHHHRAMVRCNAGVPGDERSKPMVDAHGHLFTRAPRWWVESCIATTRKERLKRV